MTSGPRCPICGAPASERLRPFCSGRCADVDLQRWLSETYVIPAEETDEDPDDDPDPRDRRGSAS